MSCTKKTGRPRRTEPAPHRGAGAPPGGDLDGVLLGQRARQLVEVLERAHVALEREPLGRPLEREQLHGVPARRQAVEVLEDVAVAAADAGVLGHVDDPQRAVGGAHRALVEPAPPALPEALLGGALAVARRRCRGWATRDG